MIPHQSKASEKLIKAARNLSKHAYLVREGEVSDYELSGILTGLLEIIEGMESAALASDMQAAKPAAKNSLGKALPIAAAPASMEAHRA